MQAIKRAISRKQISPVTYAADWTAPGGFVALGGMMTHYQLSGNKNGRLVVLIHSLGTYSAVWDDLVETLEDSGFLILRYDLLGMGFSGKAPVRNYAPKTMTLQLENLMRDLGVTARTYDMIGHGMGGQIATIFARDHPKAQGLCLIAPSGLCDEPYTGCMPCFGGSRAPHPVIGCHEEDWRRCVSDKQSAAARDFVNLQGGMFHNAAEAKDCLPRVERLFDAHGGEETIVKVLSRVGRRVFLIWGKDDEVVPYSTCMERWKKILDESEGVIKYQRVDGAGHMVMLERKEIVNQSILEWLMSRPKRNSMDQGMGNFQSMVMGPPGAAPRYDSMRVDSMGRGIGTIS